MAFLAVLAFLFVALALLAFLTFRMTSWMSRQRGTPGRGPAHRLALAMLCLVCGPLVGFVMGSLHVRFNDVNPLDRGYTIARFTALGSILGLVLGSATGLAALLSEVTQPPGKP